MEKKNYLKCLTAIMLLLASFSMASCESVIDAIFGEVDNPTGQVVQTVVSVTGATPEEVSAALKAVITDEAVQKSIANGEPIKITIASANGINSEAADQTITIPQKNKANIEISFATAPTGTDTNALVLKASEGAGTIPGNANNNLAVTMPPSNGLAITIELPTSTVTLKTNGSGAVVYKDVVAKTAKQTIIIDKGVTIKEHELVGGNIIVNNGGAIETLAVTIKDDGGMICMGSWWSGVGFKENGPEPRYEIKKEDGGYYIPKNVRLKKGAGNHVTASTNGPKDETIEKLIAGNGVNVSILFTPQYKVIKGEGNNELRVQVGIDLKNPDDDSDDEYNYAFASNTDSICNFSIKAEIDGGPGQPILAYEDMTNLIINFNADQDNGSKTFTFENCNFDDNIQFALSALRIAHYQYYLGFVNPNDEHPTRFNSLEDLLNAGIPNKIVKRDERGGYWIDDDYGEENPTVSDFTCILEFKNCKIGGEDITINNDMSTEPPTYQSNLKFTKWGLWNRDNNGIKFKVIVDGTLYDPDTRWYADNDPRNGTIELRDPNAAPPGPPAGD